MGRSFKNALYNLNLESTFKKALSNMGAKLEKLYELEPDAGLGNGGLGRLAACILDGLANGEYFSMGYSIRYEYGIFRQKLVDGWQAETPDFWLPGGEIWFEPRPEEAVDVSFDGHVNEWWDGTYHHIESHGATIVKAVPYDMMIPGKDGEGVAVLRLWEATKPGFDMARGAGVDFAAAGWAYDIPEIEEFMRKNCDFYLKSVNDLRALLFL